MKDQMLLCLSKLESAGLIGLISPELLEFLEAEEELSDFVHEQVDGAEDVIYYSKAEELYHEATTEERDNAEQQVEDCGGFGPDVETMAQRFTVLAYWILYERTMNKITQGVDELVKDLDKIVDLKNEIQDRAV
jgi:hypothetical protein